MLGMEEGSPGLGARMRAGRVVGQPQSSLFLLHRQSLGSGRRRESEGVRSPGLRAGEGQGQWIQPPKEPPCGQGPTGTPRVWPEREESPWGCRETRPAAAMLQHPLHPLCPHPTAPSIPSGECRVCWG